MWTEGKGRGLRGKVMDQKFFILLVLLVSIYACNVGPCYVSA